MEEKKKVTEAHIRATEKWEKENYDKVLVRFPKGTKERIKETGDKRRKISAIILTVLKM